MYEAALKKKLVKEFVAINRRAPTTQETIVLVRDAMKAQPKLDEVGFLGYDSYKVHIKDSSSAALENRRRTALELDLDTIANRIEGLKERLSHTYGSFNGTSQRLIRSLYMLDSRMNNLILSNSKADAFLHGIEETLTNQELVDLEATTAMVGGGYCVLPRISNTPISLDQVVLSIDAISSGHIISRETTGTIDNLKRVDGSIWTTVVSTDAALERVTLVVSIDLRELQDITSIRLATKIPDTNHRTVITTQYSVDGHNFTTLGAAEQQLFHGENEISVGVECRKLRLLLSKDAADFTEGRKSQFCFQLDSLEFFSGGWDTNEAVLTCGPYAVHGYEQERVTFTKATLNWCGVEPEGTKISWYLSQDRDTWYPAAPGALVSFARGDLADTYELIDSDLDETMLVSAVSNFDLSQDETLLNLYIPVDEVEFFNRRSVEIRRNTPDGSVYGAFPGWVFDRQSNQYRCWVDVKNPAGQLLKLGNRFATVDGRQVAGDVELQYGLHSFQTADQNLLALVETAGSETELRSVDPLYPYNHKYLIEGYPYSDGFVGDRVYPGVGEWFGERLTYVAPEQLRQMNQYSVEEIDGALYFLVKVNKQDATWTTEKFDVQYTVQGKSTDEGANALFVKAILATENQAVSPKIDSFTVRVI